MYCIFAVSEGYDPNKGDMEEGNYDYWKIWQTGEALHDCIREYYTANQGEDGIVLHKKNTGVYSDHGEED
jgi:hypothetical protein